MEREKENILYICYIMDEVIEMNAVVKAKASAPVHRADIHVI